MAVFINCALSFWFVGNPTMFSNTKIETLDLVDSVPSSHHTVGDAIFRAFTFGLTKAESVSMIGILLCICLIFAVLLSKAVRTFINSKLKKQAAPEFQQTEIPPYFEALREQDLDEMVEEEKVFVYEFNSQNMTESNLHKADDILQRIASNGMEYRSRRKLLSGEPYYQIYKNFDYWLKFNL